MYLEIKYGSPLIFFFLLQYSVKDRIAETSLITASEEDSKETFFSL